MLTQGLGAFLILLPFAVLFGAIAREDGIEVALTIFGCVAAVVAMIVVGSFLLFGAS